MGKRKSGKIKKKDYTNERKKRVIKQQQQQQKLNFSTFRRKSDFADFTDGIRWNEKLRPQ